MKGIPNQIATVYKYYPCERLISMYAGILLHQKCIRSILDSLLDIFLVI